MRNDLLEIHEVACELGLTETTIRNWLRQHKIDFVRIAPHTVRIPASEVERLIARARVPARDAGASTLDLNERN